MPNHPLTLDAECQANATAVFHTYSDLRCSWPPALSDVRKTLAVTGTVPDVRQLSLASFQLGTPGIPATTLLDWLRIASARIGSDVSAAGVLTGSLFVPPAQGDGETWTGEFVLSNGLLNVPSVAAEPVFKGDATVRCVTAKIGTSVQFELAPVSLTFGGHENATLDAHFDPSGYTLHLAGTAEPKKLQALGAAIPQLGDGLADALQTLDAESPVRFDLTSTRVWGGPRIWLPTVHTDDNHAVRHAPSKRR